MDSMRTNVSIYLDDLAKNVENIRKRLGPDVALTAVLKDNAYGHGIAGIYPTLHACGIKNYAVAFWEEARELRNAGAKEEPIQLLSPILDEDLQQVPNLHLTPTVFVLEQAEKLNAVSSKAKTITPVQIKIDTGMCRLGFPSDQDGVACVKKIAGMSHLRIEGVFTHLSRADELDCPQTEKQMQRFRWVLERLQEAGVDPGCVHVSNSAGVLLHPELQMNAVRCGDALYGLQTVGKEIWDQQNLREILSWESYVAMVKKVPAGEEVGYGGTYTTRRETIIATIPVGYADGFDHRLSNRGCVQIHGKLAPVIGNICMDQFMVDVTDLPPVQRGDCVELLNRKEITIAKMAETIGCSVDEVVCGIHARVPRLYYGKYAPHQLYCRRASLIANRKC